MRQNITGFSSLAKDKIYRIVGLYYVFILFSVT